MKTNLSIHFIIALFIGFLITGCKQIIPIEEKDFSVQSFISNIKCDSQNASFIEGTLPNDSIFDAPYVSLQSWVIKGKDMLVSITLPDNAQEIYFAASNSKASYLGFQFSDPEKDKTNGYYRMPLANLKKQTSQLTEQLKSTGTEIQYKNYVMVLSTDENVSLDGFSLNVSYKSASGVSKSVSVPVNVNAIAPYQKDLRLGFRPLKDYSYTITINAPDGKRIVFSYDKNSGKETFDNSQSPGATLTYDSQLDANWIDFDPVFGTYTMNDNVTIQISGSSQTIYLLFFIYTEGKIDQTNLNASIQYSGGSTATGIATLSFGYLSKFQYFVSIEQISTNGIKRIPMSKPKEITVTVDPPQMKNGDFITLKLVTQSGKGAAIFKSSNSNTLPIYGTTKIEILGTENSSEKENIKIIASYNGKELDSQNFSVRTWIEKMEFVGSGTIPNRGMLVTTYKVNSESGNLADLNGIFLGEDVHYDKKEWSSPPYRSDVFPIPTVPVYFEPLIIGQEGDLGCCTPSKPLLSDGQHLPTESKEHPIKSPADIFVKDSFGNYKEDVSISTQFYWFNDPVLDIHSERRKVYGNNIIRREVTNTMNGWKYRIIKINAEVGTINPQYIIDLP